MTMSNAHQTNLLRTFALGFSETLRRPPRTLAVVAESFQSWTIRYKCRRKRHKVKNRPIIAVIIFYNGGVTTLNAKNKVNNRYEYDDPQLLDELQVFLDNIR